MLDQLETELIRIVRVAVLANNALAPAPSKERVVWCDWLSYVKRQCGALSLERNVENVQRILKRLDDLDKEVIRLRDTDRSLEYYVPTGSAFVTFKSVHAAQICAQIATSWKPGVFDTCMAPEPRDVLWRSLLRRGRKSRIMGTVRQCIVFVAVWSLTIFWLFPITFILGLTSIETLSNHVAFLRYFLASSLVVRSFIQNILPTLLVTLFMSILPWLVLEISKQQDFISYSELEDSVLARYYHFSIFNVLIVFLLGTTFLTTMLDVLYEPTMLIQLLANALPQGANFFLNYILFNSSTHAMELIQLGSQIFGHFVLMQPILSRTPRMRLRHSRPWSFLYYYYYPAHILALVIALTYSVIQPLILIFSVFYFVGALIVYRHQHMYCYIRRYETNGARHYHRMARYTSDGLIIFQSTMMGLLYLKGVPAAATSILPLIVFTVWIKIKFNRLFQLRTKHPYRRIQQSRRHSSHPAMKQPWGWFLDCWRLVDDIWKFSYLKAWWESGRYAEQAEVVEEDAHQTVRESVEQSDIATTMIMSGHTSRHKKSTSISSTSTNSILKYRHSLFVIKKLATLRAEAEQANALAEEYEAKIKQLELEHTSKDHELLSLQIRTKNLEEQLDKTEAKLQSCSSDYNTAELKAEDAERTVQKLELELVEKEQYNEELLEKYNGVKSELDELARQFDEL
ncbi:MAG: hypothetical protein EXX96DRAFT_486591 [Benjaminiella poitrasii]|nr:MAG: hypothetical protein EXX96DRAFT_486591 [Benjaminiella poitrasii]